LIATADRTREELYDLRRDPGETLSVAADHPAVVEKLRAIGFAMAARCASHPYRTLEVQSVAMSAEQKEALRQLGYVD